MIAKPAIARDQADVVVVGGGIIGVACAFHLVRAGLRTVLVERGALGSGTSRTGQGGVGIDLEQEGWDVAWHRAAMASYRALVENEDGFDPDYRRRGGVFVAVDEAGVTRCRRGAERLREAGLSIDLLDGDDLRRAEPNLASDLAGGAIVDEVAEVSPLKVVSGLAALAREAGADIRLRTPLTGISVVDGAVAAAVTAESRIATPRLVIACGIWSREVAAMIGLDVPIWPLKGHLLVTEPCPGALNHYVSSTDYGVGAHEMLETAIGSDGPQSGAIKVATVLQSLPTGPILVGSSREFAGFDRSTNAARVAAIASRAIRFLPLLADRSVVRVFTGLRPWTPDGHPLVGGTAAVAGLFFAAGHGGEGTTGALLTGRVLADLMTGREPPLPTGPLSPDRFISQRRIAT